MTEQEFEQLKQNTYDDLEHRVGRVVREHFGEQAMDPVKDTLLGMTQEQFDRWKSADARLLPYLVDAIWKGLDPITEEGQRIAYLHRRWITLGGLLPYDVKNHRKLAELTAEEGRFMARYENEVPGCAAFMRDCIKAYTKSLWFAQW